MESIKELLDYAADTYKDRPAVRYLAEEKIITKTFREVKRDSAAVSNSIRALGQGRMHIAIMGRTSYLWWVSFLGIVNSANVAVPIDINLSLGDIVRELSFADVTMLMHDKAYRAEAEEIKRSCPQIKYCVELGDSPGKSGASSSDGEPPPELSLADFMRNREESSYPLDKDALCMLMFTSGTSGKSKGVMLTHRGLAVNARICSAQTGWTGEDTSILAVLPIYHIYCLSVNFLWALCLGVCLNINDDLVNIIPNARRFQANTIIMVPMILEFLNSQLRLTAKKHPHLSKRESAEDLLDRSIKNFVVGGALVKAELKHEIAAYGIEINEGYGMTESSCNIAETYRLEPRKGSVGKVVAGLEAKIVAGELWVKGETVMLGYYKDTEKTAETIAGGWLKTGDLGYFDEDGYLYLTGRKNALIVLSNGENISPEQLENQVKEGEIVREVMVYQKGDRIIAEIFPDSVYVREQNIADISRALQELIQAVNRRNPLYKHIHELIVRKTEFEKTTSKKIKRRQVPLSC
ncbi:AMP-binding protein [Desulfosporosinus shakirovi]|uniref:AMP-binding protein n=1 Tax=Desulfosporosinus shakirovi TaxID=2885154 RepID=UPI001E45CE5F|nr:class I adenylate-forming enzyme family protein [Desulfosporosinus sp. SRJS8]MCB8816726.1 acyl--CoA ligase [Desulfosporosinus sp. SRJS8]